MAAPTLTINASGQLEIADGTSGDPVTWNDVWDWDDGGGSSGGDGDVPIDGGGTAKVSAYMTEHVADAMYEILDDVTFGDGSASSYFVTKNEMIYVDDNIDATIKSEATFQMGELQGDGGINGSFISTYSSGNWYIIVEGQTTAVFKMYASMMKRRSGNFTVLRDGTIDIRDSIYCSIYEGSNNYCVILFADTVDNLILKRFYINNGGIYYSVTPDTAVRIHSHYTLFGIEAYRDVIIENANVTSFGTNDIYVHGNKTVILKDPAYHITTPHLNTAGDILTEQYPCNIHCTDKDGGNLEDVDVDCEYAHLVLGTDSKLYKCIAIFTAEDGTYRPITGGSWEDKWELYSNDGDKGGSWREDSFTFRSGSEEFATAPTRGTGDITEQTIDYKKWVGTSELLEARIHKFTFSHADYPDFVMNGIIADHPLVWEIDMGQSNANLTTLMEAAVATKLATNIPGSPPTAGSINERIKALDVLTEASGDGDLAAVLADTGTTIPALLGDIDSTVLNTTTIASLSSQTSFILTAGSTDDNAYNDCIVIIEDASTAVQKAIGYISNYDGASKRITLIADPAIFTMAATDKVSIIAATKSHLGDIKTAVEETIPSLQDTLDVLLRTLLDSTVMTVTTVATLASQTSFTLSAGSIDDDAYNSCMIILKSVSVPATKAIGFISDYTGLSKTVTLQADPGIFTLAVGDEIIVMAVPMNEIMNVKRLLRTDKVIDDSGTPWVVDYKEEGTETVLMAKTMKNTDGEDITNVDNVLGQLIKE